jgi:hypothetical protein
MFFLKLFFQTVTTPGTGSAFFRLHLSPEPSLDAHGKSMAFLGKNINNHLNHQE